MNRRRFGSVLACGGIPLVLHQSSASAAGKPTGRLTVASTPTGIPLSRQYLPTIEFFGTLKHVEPPAIDTFQRLEGEDRRTFSARRKKMQRAYKAYLKDASAQFHQWSLPDSEADALQKISLLIKEKNEVVPPMRYDTHGDSLPRVISLDVLAIRQPLSNTATISPTDLLKGDIPEIPNECFASISKLKVMESFYLNYGHCDVDFFAAWMSSRDELRILGLPLGLQLAQVDNILRSTSINTLDLSGYENNGIFPDLVMLASRAGVRWIMTSEFLTFRLKDLGIDWGNVGESFNGLIGLYELGVIERVAAMKE